MLVIDRAEVLVASIASGATTRSSAAKLSRLGPRRSTMASMTSPQDANVLMSPPTKYRTRSRAASAADRVKRPFSVSRASALSIPARARAIAPSSRSCRMTGCPATAATCAIPLPMGPAPRTPTQGVSGADPWVRGSQRQRPVKTGFRFARNAATPSA